MTLFSNKLSAGLFSAVMFIGLSVCAYAWYMAYSEKHGAYLGAIDSCKETYAKQLHDFKVTFENVSVRIIKDSDLARDMEVTGTATYVDKQGSTNQEPMECKVSVE
jgi:hypothetical protein